MQSEGVLTCEALLDEFARLDSEEATEDELVAAMEKADQTADACALLFQEQATGRGDELLFAHRSEQLRLFSLFFEAALSRRFDSFSGYCAILSDLVRIIIEGINQEQLAIESGKLSPEDERKVRELLQLDVQTLEIVSIQVDSRCAR